MLCRPFPVCGLLMLLLVGCEQPRPLSLPQAAAIADMCLDKAGADWGPTWQVVALDEPDAAGRVWIQVSYAPDPATGQARVVLVNRFSRWARMAPDGYGVVLDDHEGRPLDQPSLACAKQGNACLELRDSLGDAAGLVDRARQLNALALEQARAPLFSVRGSDDGAAVLVYGMVGDLGIAEDVDLLQWVVDVSGYKNIVWVKSATVGDAVSEDAPSPFRQDDG